MRWSILIGLVACGGGGGAVPPAMPVTTVARLAATCELGVLDVDGVTYAFSRDAVSITRDAAIVARIPPPRRGSKPTAWSGATVIRAPGGGEWAVGLADGVLWRVTSTGELEAVNERLGLGSERVLAVDAEGDTAVLGLETGILIGHRAAHAMQLTGSAAPIVAAAADRIAIGRPSWVEVFDLTRSTHVNYPVEGVTSLAFLDARSAAPRLVVHAGSALYLENGGTLRRLRTPAKLSRVVVSGSRIWMLAAAGLFSLERELPVSATLPARPRTLCRTAANDVWVSDRETSARITFERPSSDWQAMVAPVFDRVCARCHRPGGEADLDLSTPAAWVTHAAQLRTVLDDRSMPPPGVALPEPDRATLRNFLSR